MPNEHIRSLIHECARQPLKQLASIGSADLRNKVFRIYMGFGMHPGEEHNVTRILSSLPMAIIGDIPTFTYSYHHRSLPLLEVAKENDSRVLQCGMYKTNGNRATDVPIKNTEIIRLLIDGVEKIHERLHIYEDRSNVEVHLLYLTTLTARYKRLTW